jgi:hypothetical protein
MAYKFATGSVHRGDIYNEDDAQGNTFLDWSEDAVGIVVGGELAFTISGSNNEISSSYNLSASYFCGDGSLLQNVTGSGGGSTSPGGSNTQIQFNDSDSFGADSVFVWIKADNMCGVGTASPFVALDVHHTGASDPTGLTNDEGGGEVVFFGTSSAGLETGALYYLNSDGGWASASAEATGSGHSQLLGISKGDDPAEDGMLIRGFFDVHTYYSGSFTKGGPVYIHSGSNGYISDQTPSASDSYVRTVGYSTNTANVIYFNPDATYVEIA